MRLLAVFGVVVLVLGACRPQVPEDAPPEQVDRLVVVTEEGDLLTVDPRGEDLRVLADGGGHRQPTWSPDGRRIAWAALRPNGGAVVVADRTGEDRTEIPTDFPPFYLSWRPNGEAVAYLSNSRTEGIELGLVDPEDPERPRLVAGGQPFYLSWAPDGSRLLVHVGTDELSFLEPDGDRRPVGPLPGIFQAPVWGPEGRLVYAVREDGEQRLVVAGPDGEVQREVARYRGPARFVLSPDGRRLAYLVGAGSPPDGGVRAALAQGPGAALRVLDLEAGMDHIAFDGAAVAFSWSPDGAALLVLAAEADQQGRPWLRWHVRREGSGPTFERFLPSTVLARDYLPFFDQYAQSLTFWSPDGDAFVYAGRHEDGREGIWVQEAAPGSEPRLVAEGVFAAWSPR